MSTEFDCLFDNNTEKFCADPAIDFGFEEVILHPNYSGNPKSYSDDIGLVRLDQKLIFSGECNHTHRHSYKEGFSIVLFF